MTISRIPRQRIPLRELRERGLDLAAPWATRETIAFGLGEPRQTWVDLEATARSLRARQAQLEAQIEENRARRLDLAEEGGFSSPDLEDFALAASGYASEIETLDRALEVLAAAQAADPRDADADDLPEDVVALDAHLAEVTAAAFTGPDRLVVGTGGGDGLCFWDLADPGPTLRVLSPPALLELVTTSVCPLGNGGVLVAGKRPSGPTAFFVDADGRETPLGRPAAYPELAVVGSDRRWVVVAERLTEDEAWISSAEIAEGFPNTHEALLCPLNAAGSEINNPVVRLGCELLKERRGLAETGHRSSVRSVAVWPQTGQIVTAGDDGVLAWELREPIGRAIEPRRIVAPAWVVASEGFRDAVHAVAFVDGGRGVAVARSDGMFVVDAATGERTAELAGHAGAVLAFATRPEGRELLSAGSDATLRRWDAGQAAQIEAREGHRGAAVAGLAVSPDGQRIASWSRHEVWVWRWGP